jgi:FkbM family methyltransferase
MSIKELFKRYLFKVDGRWIKNSERLRLQKLPRYKYTETLLLGKRIKIVDAPTFLSSLEEIFSNEIYKFSTTNNAINIIDCGANIGLATIYFKKKYPDAKVIAFEPDPYIFKAMKDNILSFGYKDVDFRNEAISDSDSIVNFCIEGGHSGMIVSESLAKDIVPIKAVRLKNVMEQMDEITFLKIDIEGHEVNVIPDIAEQLKKVKFLFLEYHSFVDADQQLGDLLNIIQQAGLRYYLSEAYTKPFPFINREIFLKMDFLVNIFCYRE